MYGVHWSLDLRTGATGQLTRRHSHSHGGAEGAGRNWCLLDLLAGVRKDP